MYSPQYPPGLWVLLWLLMKLLASVWHLMLVMGFFSAAVMTLGGLACKKCHYPRVPLDFFPLKHSVTAGALVPVLLCDLLFMYLHAKTFLVVWIIFFSICIQWTIDKRMFVLSPSGYLHWSTKLTEVCVCVCVCFGSKMVGRQDHYFVTNIFHPLSNETSFVNCKASSVKNQKWLRIRDKS